MLPMITAARGRRIFRRRRSGNAAAACEIVNGTCGMLTTASRSSDDELWQGVWRAAPRTQDAGEGCRRTKPNPGPVRRRATFTVHRWTPFSRTALARSALGPGQITQPFENTQSTEVEVGTWKDFRGCEDWDYVKADAPWRQRLVSWGWDLALVLAIAAIAA